MTEKLKKLIEFHAYCLQQEPERMTMFNAAFVADVKRMVKEEERQSTDSQS